MDDAINYQWYFHVWKNYGNFEGRASRKEYWNFVLFNILACLAISVVSAGTLGIIYLLAAFIPSLSVAVRRLHDVGKSGWFLLISLVPFVGSIVLLVFLCMESSDKGDKYDYGGAPSFPD